MFHKYIHRPKLQNLQCCTVASEMSPGPLSVLTVTLPFRYHTRFLAANTRSSIDTLKCCLPRPEEHSTCYHQNCPFWQSGFCTRLIHATFTSHTTSSPSISSHTTYSHIIISVSKESISAVFLNFLISSSDFSF